MDSDAIRASFKNGELDAFTFVGATSYNAVKGQAGTEIRQKMCIRDSTKVMGGSFGAPEKSAHNTVRLSNSTRALRHEENT